MVKVNYVKEDNKIISLTIKGHANSAEKGKDLVCAAISSIVGGVNSLSDESFNIKIDEGFVEIKAIKNISEHDAVVLETMLAQLKSIEEGHQKFIQVKGKE